MKTRRIVIEIDDDRTWRDLNETATDRRSKKLNVYIGAVNDYRESIEFTRVDWEELEDEETK